MQQRIPESPAPGVVRSMNAPKNVTSLWAVGAIYLACSGLGFVAAVLLLYVTEGPGSPDLLSLLVQPGGQHLFSAMVAAFSVAIVFGVIGTHGLRNEVAPWRESAPQPLSFTPRAQG